jgi:hypothetical protein
MVMVVILEKAAHRRDRVSWAGIFQARALVRYGYLTEDALMPFPSSVSLEFCRPPLLRAAPRRVRIRAGLPGELRF